MAEPIKMDPCTAVMICEGVEEASEENVIAAWQYIVDAGIANHLQGCFGRKAMELIEAGVIDAGG